MTDLARQPASDTNIPPIGADKPPAWLPVETGSPERADSDPARDPNRVVVSFDSPPSSAPPRRRTRLVAPEADGSFPRNMLSADWAMISEDGGCMPVMFIIVMFTGLVGTLLYVIGGFWLMLAGVALLLWLMRPPIDPDRSLVWEGEVLVEHRRGFFRRSRRSWSRAQVTGVTWHLRGVFIHRNDGGRDDVEWGDVREQSRNAAEFIAEGFGLTATCDDGPTPAPG
jgi:hypothetical protein